MTLYLSVYLRTILPDTLILEEVTGGKRDKIYIYRRYLSILEEGTEPL